MYEDKTLICKECGREFVFSAGEQEFYEVKGFLNEPRRCGECRAVRKSARHKRELHTVMCAACGREAQVPFLPRGDSPVYCDECFRRLKAQEHD